MSIYKKSFELLQRYISPSNLFKYGFNYSPMYRRSTGKIISISKDLTKITVRIRISWKNRNYMNTLFGGSMFSAVDPIPMIQLVQILGKEYVIWDKSAEIFFKRPAKEDLYAKFEFSPEQIQQIKHEVSTQNEIDFEVHTFLTNKDGDVIFCEIRKKIYISTKSYYKEKLANRLKNQNIA